MAASRPFRRAIAHRVRDGNALCPSWLPWGHHRIAPGGTEIGQEIQIVANTLTGRPSMVWTGNVYGVSWSDQRHGATEIYFCLIVRDSDGDDLLAADSLNFAGQLVLNGNPLDCTQWSETEAALLSENIFVHSDCD